MAVPPHNATRIAALPASVRVGAIVAYLPGSIAELKPGAIVFIPAAINQPDGTLEAQRVMVGRDVAPPQ